MSHRGVIHVQDGGRGGWEHIGWVWALLLAHQTPAGPGLLRSSQQEGERDSLKSQGMPELEMTPAQCRMWSYHPVL